MTGETFGAVLRSKRRDSGISQRELAKRVGVDFSYISKIENDHLPPPAADTIVKICEVLGNEPDELLALTGKISTQVQETIASQLSAQQFLREAGEMRLTDEEWQHLTESLKRLRDE